MNELQFDKKKIEKCKEAFLAGKPFEQENVRAEILSSWERCQRYGLDARKPRKIKKASKEYVEKTLSTNKLLLDVAIPFMDHLIAFSFTKKITVSLSDANGCILHSNCVEGNLLFTSESLHTIWSERDLGTNPLGTALAINKPIEIYASEFYCNCKTTFSGACAPIHDSAGHTMGAILIAHEESDAECTMLTTATMAAYFIEQQLKQKKKHSLLTESYKHIDMIINSISEGILVLNHNQTITVANHAISDFFGTSPESIIGKPIHDFVTDGMLIKAISSENSFTDYVTKITVGGGKYPCTITKRTLRNVDESSDEAILVINDQKRFRKMSKKLQGEKTLNTFENIVAVDPNFKKVIEEAKTFARSDANVLILGESGTGKDVIAQAIHNASARSDGPFIAINCGAVQKELFMSELFGYEEGSFTGARSGGMVGKLEAANGGTVFLDEIGEMPLDIQPILLRAIEQRTITRVGGKKGIPIDVRIIAATNKNLRDAIDEGTFRSDLYYRLDLFTLTLPPLRERPEDIPALIDAFLTEMNIKYDRDIKGYSEIALDILVTHDWPGNIRELRHSVERSVVLCTKDYITPDLLPKCRHLKEYMHSAKLHALHYGNPLLENAKNSNTYSQTRASSNREDLLSLLEANRWNVTKVAQILGVTRSTVYNRMKKEGVHR